LVKRWLVFCEPCSYKRILVSSEPHDLVEVKTAPIPGGAPRLDPETKKAKDRPVTSQPKKFKCPQCGRGVRATKLADPYLAAFKEVDGQKRKREEELEKQKRLEDGQPVKREKDPDFLG